MKSSLKRNLIASARGWKMPPGVGPRIFARWGPGRPHPPAPRPPPPELPPRAEPVRKARDDLDGASRLPPGRESHPEPLDASRMVGDRPPALDAPRGRQRGGRAP